MIFKRITISALVVFMIISLSSCGAVSGISITDMQNSFSQVLVDKVEFEKEKTADGYDFSFFHEDSVATISYSGKADKAENVKSITITNNEVDISIIKDKASLMNSLTKPSGKMTRIDLRANICFVQAYDLCTLFCKTYEGESNDSWDAFADEIGRICEMFNGEKITIDKWTVYSEIDETNKTVTIKAVYA